MTTRRCERCGGGNVDFEGYCWDCEYQPGAGGSGDWSAGPAEPPGPASATAAEAGPGGPRRSTASRLLVMIVAPLTTIALIICAYLGTVIFREADELIGGRATPSVLAPSDPAAGPTPDPVTACLTGTWRRVTGEQTITLAPGKVFQGTGSGGTLLLAAAGSGSFDHTGSTMEGSLDGVPATLTQAGVTAFRYQVTGGQLGLAPAPSTGAGPVRATVTARGTGQVLYQGERPGLPARAEGSVECGGDALRMTGRAGTAGQDLFVFSESYTRTS